MAAFSKEQKIPSSLVTCIKLCWHLHIVSQHQTMASTKTENSFSLTITCCGMKHYEWQKLGIQNKILTE